MPWTLDILPLAGGAALTTAAPFRSARITWALDGSGAAEIELLPTDIASGNWLYGRRRVRFKDGAGTSRYQGWLDRLERAGSPSAVAYRASSRGLAAILEQRVVHGDVAKIEVVSTTIATDLIAHMVAQTYDKTGFTAGTITGVAPARSRWYCDGDVISEALNELAVDFAWEISPTGAFNAWVGGRGADRSATVSLAPEDVMDWSCTGDVTELASFVTGLGDGDEDTPCGPPLVVDFDTTLRTDYGRREAVIAEDTKDEDELLEKTTEELRARAASGLNLRTAWIEGRGPWNFGDVWLGDVVSAALGTEFGGTKDMRLVSVSVALEPGTHEFVECEWEAA